MRRIETIIARIGRLVAPNGGPGTHDGTNTYFLREPDGMTVIDAGPALEEHVDAILTQAGGPIRRILNTHTHLDHAGAARALSARTGAPVYGYRQPMVREFTPDIGLGDGDRVGSLTAVFTPGHARDHLCFSWSGAILFSGDHVMDWASSLVRPPHGDMADYMASIEKLQRRRESLYLPGHGPPVISPAARLADLLARRRHREQKILARLALASATLDGLTAQFYPQEDETFSAGRGIVEAHLLKLRQDGKVVDGDSGQWRLVRAAL
ncbi:MBL fold metallo-hydrolase [Devosia faecipullorum]|uniref:MBL fold metallo-hydrolase n=1 Tax=Devosia faecipullorum TaxID=2755039 RepID=UPI00187B603F|nr:MBL fold metallo-hydrolase [Devosia faecipullorum]MBE7732580.1 MBL fold metallo-hydrolase [Devosia faecipullorum]